MFDKEELKQGLLDKEEGLREGLLDKEEGWRQGWTLMLLPPADLAMMARGVLTRWQPQSYLILSNQSHWHRD